MTSSDEQAFERLYRETYSDLVTYCRRRLPADSDTVDDVVAQVYLTAWRRLDDFLTVDKPIAWLYAVAYRTVSNRYRARRRGAGLQSRLRLVRPPAVIDPADHVLGGSALGDLNRALDQLDPVDREIVMLAAWEGLTYIEIGQITDLTVAAVRTRLFRARRSLSDHVEAAERDGSDVVDTDISDLGNGSAGGGPQKPGKP
jgi:RNA polymerase sigma-70 factor, ECF subfamily